MGIIILKTSVIELKKTQNNSYAIDFSTRKYIILWSRQTLNDFFSYYIYIKYLFGHVRYNKYPRYNISEKCIVF